MAWNKITFNDSIYVYIQSVTFFSILASFFTVLRHPAEPAYESGSGTFTLIAPSGLPYDKLYYRSGAEFVPVKLRMHRRSVRYMVPSTESMELFDHRFLNSHTA